MEEKTILEKIDIKDKQHYKAVLKKAANILKNNGLVCFPTETVYGLGANALSTEAVNKIYVAKGRPSDNPLIIHISQLKDLENLVYTPCKYSMDLMQKFSPGALTIILKKKNIVPNVTSGGLDTVAVRIPKNKIALDLIEECGFPLAAPSANTSGKPSPTSAKHVFHDLENKVDMILDGGNCSIGLESTVVEVVKDTAIILRPGSITKEMLQEVIPNVILDKSLEKRELNSIAKSPGVKYKHYAPKADLVIVSGNLEYVAKKILLLLEEDIKNGIKSLVISSDEALKYYPSNILKLNIGSREINETIAKSLFSILRQCDNMNLEKIYIEAFSESGLGLAIMNRLKKASNYNIINV